MFIRSLHFLLPSSSSPFFINSFLLNKKTAPRLEVVGWKSSTHRGHEIIIPWSASHKDPIIDTIIRESSLNVSVIGLRFLNYRYFQAFLVKRYFNKRIDNQQKNMRSFIMTLHVLLQHVTSHSKSQFLSNT